MRFFVPVVGNQPQLRASFAGSSGLTHTFMGVNRAAALMPSTPTGGGTEDAAGLTFLPQIHIGYAYMFLRTKTFMRTTLLTAL